MNNKPLILFFKDIDKEDIPLVGGKGANLGEMVKIGLPVPDGFAITVHAYDLFLEKNNLKPEIDSIIANVKIDNPDELMRSSREIQKKIIKAKVPLYVAKEVSKSYKKISGRFKKSYVAVRSSATAEDLPGASFAGQQATFLNVKGEANLVEAVKNCWASLFTARAIFYRHENKIREDKVKISVIVQKMVQSEVSGVMFSIDPVSGDKDKIIIEAVWGLGELIVQGSVVPDTYAVQKGTFTILSKEISNQSIELIKKGEKTIQVDVPKSKKEAQKLKDEDIVKLAKILDKLERHYYFPQDSEWAKEGKKLYIVQTRPVTTIENSKKKLKEQMDSEIKLAKNPIVKGVAASPGIGTGEVKILKSAKEIEKVKAMDVIVTKMTSPDFVPAMKKASAIVTDEGGLTSHAAIVSRELGVPCVVGTKNATTLLREKTVVTVDGTRGLVFVGGKIKIEKTKIEENDLETMNKHLSTATKVYVNLTEPKRAAEIARKNVDGVGLLRAEFMIANIGIHPKEAIKKRKQYDFIKKLASDISIFCKNFYPRPVVYRATDFKTNEYRSLPGGEAWEPEEPNPMLGFRGAFRYIANPDVFNLELQAIKKVREKYNNLWLMIPFVRSPEELAKIKRLVAAEDLFRYSSFKLWMMVELPVNVIKLTDFIKVGIDGISIGSNDLTMLLLGTDRDNSEVAKAFNEKAPVVFWALKRTIRLCNKYGISSSICGQAPTIYDDLVRSLVNYGITSISVNPDAIDRVRLVISEAEKEIIKR